MSEVYGEMVAALAKDGNAILEEMTPKKAHLLHMMMGISGEAGETLDAIKKHVIYNKPLDIDHLIEELGDIEFYMEGLRQGLGLNRDLILLRNSDKLHKRYSEGTYSDKAATTRADKA